MGVDTEHPDYLANIPDWVKMDDVCKSESHMQLQGIKYVPKLDEMTDAQYAAYLARAEFPMFTKHALGAFVGMAMRKELLISGIDVDHDFFKNCDGKGTTLKLYAEKLVKNFLQFGRCGTLIDMPLTNENESIATAEAKNIRTKLLFYDYSSIINWNVEEVDNLDVLTMVVLKEKLNVAENEFDHEEAFQYRVLRLRNGIYTQQVYDTDLVPGPVITPLMKGKPLNKIPFIIHGGAPVQSPIMLPIAEQNIHWYMKDADYQHGLHYTALPTPYIIGVDANDPEKPKTVGPSKMWYLPEGASCGMLEFEGKGLAEIAKSMEKTMTNITVLSSQILVPKNTFDETATAANIRNATETASLSSIVAALSGELTTAVVVASQWGGFYVDGTEIEINSDFIPLTLSGADVAAYVSSVLKQGFSERTLFELLKKGEIIPGDRQYEDEQADIRAEAKRRMDEEVELAQRLSKIEAALTKLTQSEDGRSDKSPVDKDQDQRGTQKDPGTSDDPRQGAGNREES